MADKDARQIASDVAARLGIPADVPMTAEQAERFEAEFERALAEGEPLRVRDVKPEQVVLHFHWREDGKPRQETYGPWDIDPEGSHLERAREFIHAWHAATGLHPDTITIAIAQDPDAWLRAHQEGRG